MSAAEAETPSAETEAPAPDYLSAALQAFQTSTAAEQQQGQPAAPPPPTQEAPAPAQPEQPAAPPEQPAEPPQEVKKPEGEAPPEPPPDLLSYKAQQIANQENRLRQEREAFKSERKQYETEFNAWRSAREAAARGDDGPALQVLGLSFHDLARREAARLQNGGTPRQAPQAQQQQGQPPPEIAGLQQQLQQLQAQLQQSQYESARANVHASIIKAGEQYELINAEGAHDEVVQALHSHIQEHQQLPGKDWEDSIRLTAEFIENTKRERANRLLTTKWVKGKIQPVAPQSAVASPQTSSGTPASPIPNSQSSAVPPRGEPVDFSPEACFERAKKLLEEGKQG